MNGNTKKDLTNPDNSYQKKEKKIQKNTPNYLKNIVPKKDDD